MKRKKSYGTATYNGIDYSVYDALPKRMLILWIVILTRVKVLTSISTVQDIILSCLPLGVSSKKQII